MGTESRVRVYMACSLDGFIAGPDDDLAWLTEGSPGPDDPPIATDALEFGDFIAQVGCMLMGRHTHDVVLGFGEWPYGDLPVLVPTHRPLQAAATTVQAVSGDIGELVAQAKQLAGDKDVYLDGGNLVQQALNAGLVDELCMTVVPILLGSGKRLFDGLEGRTKLEFVETTMYGHMVQMTARPNG